MSTSSHMTFLIDKLRSTSLAPSVAVMHNANVTDNSTINNNCNNINNNSIKTNPKVYRPKLASQYIEPDICPDLLDDMELLYKDFGSSLRQTTQALPPRSDIIVFDHNSHQGELDKNIRWHECPQEFQPTIISIIKQYWDVFCEEGLRRNIRGYVCRIDTGDISPVCCKPPRYGPHESVIMNKLVAQLQINGLIEDDDGPWGAVIVLAAKHGQENTPWHDYIWRLCVSYRRLNQITRPFKFPIPRCDDAVMDISPRASYFISFDLDSGYWQISLEEASRAKTAFFTPSGKKRWTVMPMGSLNAMSIFVAMMTDLQAKWNDQAKASGLHGSYRSNIQHPTKGDDYGSAVIADDVTLYAEKPNTLLKYFRIVLSILQHHRVTIKLKKCNFLSPNIEFVGINVGPNGNSPASSKFDALRKLPPPSTWSELRRAIGFIGFYQQWIHNFELRLSPLRKLQHRQPLPGELPLDDEKSFFAGFWLPNHDTLFKELIEEVIASPTLQRPDPSRRFYVKTDWSKDGIGAVLLQADVSEDSRIAEEIENQGGPCNFDLTRSGLRLRPISFLSRKTTPAEQSYHSYVGEASAGRWAFSKWRKHLFGKEFTWLTDCNGLRQFFDDSTELANHMLQRWRAELLLYNFTIEHRPASMLTECDMLSRYNKSTSQWYHNDISSHESSILAVHQVTTIPAQIFPLESLEDNPKPRRMYKLPKQQTIGNLYWPRSKPTEDLFIHRNILIDNVIGLPVQEALSELGLTSQFNIIGTDVCPNVPSDLIPTFQILDNLSFYSSLGHTTQVYNIDWFINVYPFCKPPLGQRDSNLHQWLLEVSNKIETLIKICALQVAIIFLPITFPAPLTELKKLIHLPTNWTSKCYTIRNCAHGGSIETDHSAVIVAEQSFCSYIQLPSVTCPPSSMAATLIRHTLPTVNTTTGDVVLMNPTPAYLAGYDSPLQATTAKLIKNKVDVTPINGWPVFDVNGPGPNISSIRPEQLFFQGLFAVWYQDPPSCCPVDTKNALLLLGLHASHISLLCKLPPDICERRCRNYPGKEGLKAILQSLSQADFKHKRSLSLSNTTNTMIILPDNDMTVLPLPDLHAWQTALTHDHDTAIIITHLSNDTTLEEHELVDKTYYKLFQQKRFDIENGILRYYEHSRTSRLRQLSLRVVPISLRRTIIAACHSSPFGGHSGITKTLFRIQTRFWWPAMTRDIHEGIKGCAHCNLSNAVSHEAALELHTLACDVPFDVIFLDIWSPGDVMDKSGTTKVLTMIDCMTSFAMVAFLHGNINAENVANATLSTFFIAVGLPRLVVVDADNIFAGVFKQLFQLLMIPIHQVSRENHKAIRNERFHRYLNKVQRINTADTGSLFRWKQGVLFSVYAWNAAPIDGTDIGRSVVAMSRDFPFPIDIESTVMRGGSQDGQDAIDYHDAASPLIYRQRALLNILNTERRQRHLELRNANKTTPSFSPGDIVIVRKQVKSNSAQGISAKLLFRTKGPYRVLEQVTPSSYHLQKLPFLRGLGIAGKIRKENAARMTKLPSTLVIHKRANGADTRFSQLAGSFAQMPLQKWLRAMTSPGSYTQTTSDKTYAFEPINTIWSDVVDEVEDNEFSDSSLEEVTEHKQTDTLHEDPNNIETDLVLPIPTEQDAATHIDPKEDHNQATQWPILPQPSISTRKALNNLYKSICDSTDRIFFIVGSPHPENTVIENLSPIRPDEKSFSIAQVCWNATNPVHARESGVYKMRLWVQAPPDISTRSLSQSRFYPALQSTNQANTTIFPTKPLKAQQVLDNDPTLMWPLFDVPLAEVRIIGPLNFTQQRIGLKGPKKLAVSETHHIDDIYWQQLEKHGSSFGINTDNIWTIPRI